MRGIASIVATVAVASVTIAGCTGASPRTEVALYGDSLLFEARATVHQGLGDVGHVIHAQPGAAPCDLLPRIRRDLPRLRPEVVVIETAGSNLTPCISGAGRQFSKGFVARYTRDLRTIVHLARARGADVLILDPPPIGALVATSDAPLRALGRALRRAVGSDRGVSFASGPRASVSDAGAFAVTLPCLRSERNRPECRNGRIAVRDPVFGVHFCPVPYPNAEAVSAGCPRYSSGAIRYGRAIVAAIERRLAQGAGSDAGADSDAKTAIARVRARNWATRR